ncbi:MAG: PEGA domain-containing protein [Terriglobales bacterium]
MIRFLRILLLTVLCTRLLAAAEPPWQYGRIVDIKKSVSSYIKAWVVNTPVSEDRTVYTISAQVADKILVGDYDVSAEQPEPPQDWAAGYPVKVQVSADSLYLRSVTGELRLLVKQRRAARRPLQPLTADEKKHLDELDAPPGSLIGFSERSSRMEKTAPAESAPPPAQPPPPPTTGTVNVRSTPYLSEVFVDGDSMGYTPAKIALPPGKHSFWVEKPGYKPWTKEMTITVGSELTLDASLEKK